MVTYGDCAATTLTLKLLSKLKIDTLISPGLRYVYTNLVLFLRFSLLSTSKPARAGQTRPVMRPIGTTGQ